MKTTTLAAAALALMLAGSAESAIDVAAFSYEGGWKDGEKHGQGVWTHPDGRRYEGQWKDGKWHGQGVETHPDGRRYEGQWKDGKPLGGD